MKELISQIGEPAHQHTGYTNAEVCGLMGMASFSEDENKVRSEFKKLRKLFDEINDQLLQKNPDTLWSAPNVEPLNLKPLNLLSMGMSGDYKIALEEGSNMIRIGSLIFGGRL